MFLVEARPEPATQRYIQIIDVQTGNRVVTTIELISPSNKRPGPARQLYLALSSLNCNRILGGEDFAGSKVTKGFPRSVVE